jgi:hypothetical protein
LHALRQPKRHLFLYKRLDHSLWSVLRIAISRAAGEEGAVGPYDEAPASELLCARTVTAAVLLALRGALSWKRVLADEILLLLGITCSRKQKSKADRHSLWSVLRIAISRAAGEEGAVGPYDDSSAPFGPRGGLVERRTVRPRHLHALRQPKRHLFLYLRIAISRAAGEEGAVGPYDEAPASELLCAISS